MKILARVLAVIMIFCSFGVFAGCKGKYLVAYEVNGGTAIESQWLNKIKDEPVTTREGYEFLGWYYEPTFKTLVEFPLKLTTDITLYANWKKTLEQYKKEYNEIFYEKVGIGVSSLEGAADNINFKTKVGVSNKLAGGQLDYEESGISVDLVFPFGGFVSATGNIYYEYKEVVGGVAAVHYTATFKVNKLIKDGEKYVLDGYFCDKEDEFLNFSKTDADVLKDIEQYFNWRVSDVEVLAGDFFAGVIYEYA